MLRSLQWSISLIVIISLFSCENADNAVDSHSSLNESFDLIEDSIVVENIFYDSLNLIIDTNVMEVIQLKTLKAFAYNYDERLKTKLDIYNLRPSYEYHTWKNPTSGGSVHINSNDEVIVYKSLYSMSMDSAHNFHYLDYFHCPDSIDLKRYVSGYTYGNAPSVLITSEINPRESKAMDKILKDLFRSHQLYYFVTRQK